MSEYPDSVVSPSSDSLKAVDLLYSDFAAEHASTRTRRALLRTVMMSRLVHHRAQLGVYLRLLDIEIPGMYGASADEMAALEKR